jgi:hypothetical protein
MSQMRKILIEASAAVRYAFEPIARWFSWWRGWKSNRFGVVVVAPDNFAWLFVLMAPLPVWPAIMLSKYYLFLLLALPLYPVLFTSAVVIGSVHVRWFKCFFFIPYWTRKMPADAKFSLFEAWEDPAPSSVAFESDSRRTFGDPHFCIHFGSARSAGSLYSFIGSALKQVGWVELHGELKKARGGR